MFGFNDSFGLDFTSSLKKLPTHTIDRGFCFMFFPPAIQGGELQIKSSYPARARSVSCQFLVTGTEGLACMVPVCQSRDDSSSALGRPEGSSSPFPAPCNPTFPSRFSKTAVDKRHRIRGIHLPDCPKQDNLNSQDCQGALRSARHQRHNL